MTDLMTISYFYTVKNDLSENTIRTMILLADYKQQSQGSVNTADYIVNGLNPGVSVVRIV